MVRNARVIFHKILLSFFNLAITNIIQYMYTLQPTLGVIALFSNLLVGLQANSYVICKQVICCSMICTKAPTTSTISMLYSSTSSLRLPIVSQQSLNPLQSPQSLRPPDLTAMPLFVSPTNRETLGNPGEQGTISSKLILTAGDLSSATHPAVAQPWPGNRPRKRSK